MAKDISKVRELAHPDNPATSRQLWFLHILTGLDTRGYSLTQLEAQGMIAKAKAEHDKSKAKAKKAAKPVKKVLTKVENTQTATMKGATKKKVTPVAQGNAPTVAEIMAAAAARGRAEVTKAVVNGGKAVNGK